MYSCWEELDFWDRKGRDMSGKIDLDLAALGDLGYGKSLAIVGLERGSGKTTLTDNLLQLSRRTNSPVAVLSIGYERPARGSNSSSGHYHGASLPRPAATESTETTGEYRVSPGPNRSRNFSLIGGPGRFGRSGSSSSAPPGPGQSSRR